jgi:hypothetical protein
MFLERIWKTAYDRIRAQQIRVEGEFNACSVGQKAPFEAVNPHVFFRMLLRYTQRHSSELHTRKITSTFFSTFSFRILRFVLLFRNMRPRYTSIQNKRHICLVSTDNDEW